MDLVDEIRKLVEENLSPDKFVVEVLISGKKIPKRVLIIIDGDQGVTIDACADLSRVLSKAFDERRSPSRNFRPTTTAARSSISKTS